MLKDTLYGKQGLLKINYVLNILLYTIQYTMKICSCQLHEFSLRAVSEGGVGVREKFVQSQAAVTVDAVH